MRNLKSIRKRFLILCEGESEIKYFKSYCFCENNRERLRGVEVEIYKPVDHSPLGLVKEAKRKFKESKRDKLPYESIWVVFDKDGHSNISNAFEEARNFNPEINIAFSSICFEYWIVLHFVKRKICFRCGDDAVSFIKGNYIQDYKKVKVGFEELQHLFETAIINASWLHKQNIDDLNNGRRIYELDSFTNIDEIMKWLKQLNT